MNEPRINVDQLLEGLLEIKSVCSMATKQANAMINQLSQLAQQAAQQEQQETKTGEVNKDEAIKKVAEKMEEK